MDIYIVIGSCGMVGDVKTWIVDAWETQSDADARIEQLVEFENKFWGDYDLFNYGKIVEKEMRVAENGDPGYIHDAFTAVGYVTQKSKLKK